MEIKRTINITYSNITLENIKKICDTFFYKEPIPERELNITITTNDEYTYLYNIIKDYIEAQKEKFNNGFIRIFIPEIGFLNIKNKTPFPTSIN